MLNNVSMCVSNYDDVAEMMADSDRPRVFLIHFDQSDLLNFWKIHMHQWIDIFNVLDVQTIYAKNQKFWCSFVNGLLLYHKEEISGYYNNV